MHQRRSTFPRGLLFDLLLVTGLSAQIKIHHNLTVEDGLVQSQVLSIYEDRRGYLWMGTFDGVSRWDGVEFTNFQLQETSIPSECLAFGEDDQGALYFGTAAGLMIQRPGANITLVQDQILSSVAIRTIYHSSEGKLFLGTNDGLIVYDGRKSEDRSQKYGLTGETITAIAEDGAGALYFGTAQGVCV